MWQALAFWLFTSLMGRFRSHFDASNLAMHERLDSARALIMFMQPRIFELLAEHDLLAMFYCYRWVLLHFKREFPLLDVRVLWCVASMMCAGDAGVGVHLGGAPITPLRALSHLVHQRAVRRCSHDIRRS